MLLTAFIVLANLWADYQPLSWGSEYGGGDGDKNGGKDKGGGEEG